MKKLFLILALIFAIPAYGQVSQMPFTKSQFFDNSGHPLSGGRLYTYQAGTTTPLVTYRDSAGTILNTNPVILDSAGRADVWLTSAAYKLVLQNSSGVLIWSEDGITSSNIALLGLNNIWTGTQTYNGAVTFNSSALFNSGFTSAGPAVFNGGGTLNNTWAGSPTFGGVPNFSAGFLATTGSFSGQIASTLATGTAPFSIASTTQVPNLNVSQLEGCTWEVPCALGSTTPNSIKGTTGNFSTSLVVNGSTAQTAIQGTDTNLLSSGTMTGVTGIPLCKDANGGATTTGCQTGGFTKVQVVKKVGSLCNTGGGSNSACTDTLTWPTSFGSTAYIVSCTGVDPNAFIGQSTTNTDPTLTISSYTATTVVVITQTSRSLAAQYAEVHCIGILP